MIPKIIHQIWVGGTPPPRWAKLAGTWRRQHPDWIYPFWTDANSRPFVSDHYPDLLRMYDGYPYTIQRADALRYMLLHSIGGVYADMDFECLRQVDKLVAGHGAVLVRAPPGDLYFSNGFMAAEPGHPFLGAVLEALACDRPVASTHQEVLETTGPAMLDEVFGRQTDPAVHILDAHIFYPFTNDRPELKTIAEGQRDALRLKLACISHGSYAIHYWAFSWRNQNLVNPNPRDIDGFVFFPQVDSVGYDIRNAGRSITDVAQECAACEVSVAFNTDGYLKFRLRPRRHWELRPDWDENEGLFVKRSATSWPLWPILGVGWRRSQET